MAVSWRSRRKQTAELAQTFVLITDVHRHAWPRPTAIATDLIAEGSARRLFRRGKTRDRASRHEHQVYPKGTCTGDFALRKSAIPSDATNHLATLGHRRRSPETGVRQAGVIASIVPRHARDR